MLPLSFARRIARKSPKQLVRRVVQVLGDRVGVSQLDFPLLDRDIRDAQQLPLQLTDIPSPAGRPARIAWIVVAPGIGSGGHTTLFRMIDACGRAGYENTLLFYDTVSSDFATNVDRVRRGWPWLRCDFGVVGDALEGFDAYVASSWPTAHVLAARSTRRGAHLYFIQDFEPYFYPRGTLYQLAKDSYRLGLRNVALGQMVADAVREDSGAAVDVVPFGCDHDVYSLPVHQSRRRGIAYFAKINSDRRGYRLALLALQELQRRRPDVPIHVYGDVVPAKALEAVNHGYLGAEDLNKLYGGVVAGLVLSFTNISLIPSELAAAGAVPVMNDEAAARSVFPHPEAVWSSPSPSRLADALEAVLDGSNVEERARRVANWRGPTWADTAAGLLAVLHAATPAGEEGGARHV